MAWSPSFHIFISCLILFRLKCRPFLPSSVPYCPRSEREIKPSLKALKDLKNISNKQKGLKDLEDKNSK